MKNDPDWARFAASLREGTLYVKMPLSKARKLVIAMEAIVLRLGSGPIVDGLMPIYKFLLRELRRATNRSLFYAAPCENVLTDIEALMGASQEDRSGILVKFCTALVAGLHNDPEFDWISRSGGPKP